MQVRAFFLSLSLLLAALPLEAQRGGGFSGRGSSGRPSGGHVSAWGGSAGSARSVSHTPGVSVSRTGWVVRTSSAQVLVRSQPRVSAPAVSRLMVTRQPFARSVVLGGRGARAAGSARGVSRPIVTRQPFAGSVVLGGRGARPAGSARAVSRPVITRQPFAGSVVLGGRGARAASSARQPSGTQWFGRPFSFSPPDPFFFDQNFFFFDRFHRHIFLGGQFGFPPFCVFSGGHHAFFFQPFFHRRFFSPFFFPFVTPFVPFVGGVEVVEAGVVGAEVAPTERNEVRASEVREFPEEAPPGQPAEQAAPAKLAVLVLKDGWTYEVTDYWVENGQLRYVTSYGGENAAALEAIDFDQTAQQNWERGVEFALRPKPRAR